MRGNLIRTYISFLVILITLTCSQSVSAQQQGSQDTLTMEMESIEVKSTHSSISSDQAPRSVIQKRRDLAEINSSASMTLDKLTYDMPGIWINNRHNYAFGQRMLIRGLGWRAAYGIRGIQVILDGIPLTTAGGQTVTNLLDPAFVRDIEVLRGPASTYWGNSSGGVVYLSTKPDYENAPVARVRGIANSYELPDTDLRKTEAEFIHRWNQNRLHVFGSYFRQDGFRDHSSAEMGRLGLTSRLHLTDKSSLRIFGAYASMPKAENPSSLSKETAKNQPTSAYPYFSSNNAREKADHAQAGLTYYRQLDFGTLTATGYGVYRDLISPLPFSYIDLDRLMGGSRFILEQENSNWSWNLGIETKYQHDDRINRNTVDGEAGDQLTLDQLETVTNLSGFGLLEYQPFENWTLSGGIRYDWLRFKAVDHLLNDGDQSGNRTFQALSPSLGLSYDLSEAKLYANASTAFEAPTTTELVNRPGNQGGYNPNIEPEKTVSLETGITNRNQASRFHYDVTFYTMWISDFLLPYQIQGSSRVYYRNEGRTRHSGIELMSRYRITPDLQAQVTYNFIRARFMEGRTADGTAIDENSIPGVPPHRLSASTVWTPGNFRLHLIAEWVSRYSANSINTFYNDRYFILNSRFSHSGIPLGNEISLKPFIEIDNMNDNRYNSSVTVNASGNRYYEPAPGRHLTAGVALEFY